ncbi:hypothetical protein P7C73_g359, partial [Tremellales sp. Uapishka_1]
MLDPHGLFIDLPPPSKEQLEFWLDENGIQRHPALEISVMEDGGGWRVLSRRDIFVGELLCQIPKTSLLSTRTTSLPSLMSLPVGSTTSHSVLYLALVLLHEMRMGDQSTFYGYLQSLPRETIMLPVLWELAAEDGRAGREWLKGTEAERVLRQKDSEGLSLHDLQAFYGATAPHLPPTPRHPLPSPFAAFAYTYSLVSTRAFLIDLYHTIALCPFADLFNHSSIPHSSLQSDDFVCHHCGSLRACTHDPTPARLSHLAPCDLRRIDLEIDSVDMRVERPVEKDCEVFNCYGENLGDGRLLVEWGYIGQEFTGELHFALEEKGESRLIDSSGSTNDLDHSEESLIQLPDPDDLEKVSLNQSAQISRHFFAMSYRSALRTEENEANLVQYIRLMEDTQNSLLEGVQSGASPLERARLLAIAQNVKTKLEERLSSTYRPELSQEQLFELRGVSLSLLKGRSDSPQNLPDAAVLCHTAVTVAIDEWSLLRAAIEKWRDLIVGLGGS